MATSSNQSLIPEAKAKLAQFKTEVASSLGVNLKQGYNGDLTSREAGSIGGEMVKRMIAYAEQSMPNSGVGSTSGTGGGRSMR